jgi:diguanylate cyclase (GGDEF)-like protein
MYATEQTVGPAFKYLSASFHLVQQGPSNVPGLDLMRTHDSAVGASIGRAEANQFQHMQRRGSSRRQSGQPSIPRNAPGSLGEALLDLAVAERQFLGALRENESLKINNEYLMQALDDASRRAVAAQHVAQHDGLTGLPNRLLLIKRLQMAIRNASERHRQLALLFIDLDGFKAVNDRFGHRAADRLLSAVGARIAASVRADDIASRYGGDEFVALLSNVDDAAIAVSIAEKVRKHIGDCYSIEGMEIHITASIGLAMYPADGERYDALLNRADAAMYCDKAARRPKSALCETPMSAGTNHR